MSKEVTVTFKTSEPLARLLSQTAFEIDKNKSEVVRCCILLSIDTVRNCPSLVHRIQINDREVHNIEVIER